MGRVPKFGGGGCMTAAGSLYGLYLSSERGQWTHNGAIPWVALGLMAVAVVLFALGFISWWRDKGDREIGRRCKFLANDLSDLLADHAREDPRTLAWGANYPVGDTRRAKAQEKKENEHRAKLASEFQRKYVGQAAALLHEAEERGALDESQAWHAKSAFIGTPSDYSIQELITALNIAAWKLGYRDD